MRLIVLKNKVLNPGYKIPDNFNFELNVGMKTIIKNIDSLADSNFEWVKEFRRDLHRYPEVSYKEFRTTDVIIAELKRLNITVLRPLETGCVGIITGGIESDRVIALRADIDALPMEETGEHKREFLSKNQGVAHCCGHDLHTANLLGVARILSELRTSISGKVVLVFQPGEEKVPGGGRLLMETGLLQELGVQEIYGLHSYPYAPPGEIRVIKGAMMARPDEFSITVLGKGGHAAIPHKAVDPVVIASQIVTMLQSIISRTINPLQPAVLTIGKISGGSAHNVIPESVTMLGTIRTFSKELSEHISDRILQTAQSIARAAGGDIEYKFNEGYPAVVNTDWAVDSICEAAEMMNVGVTNLAEPIMAGEDFSYYLQEIPGSFFYLGSGSRETGSDQYNWHHPLYNVDERAMKTGMRLMAGLVFNRLSSA